MRPVKAPEVATKLEPVALQAGEVATKVEPVAPQAGEVAVLPVPVAPTMKRKRLSNVAGADTVHTHCVMDIKPTHEPIIL